MQGCAKKINHKKYNTYCNSAVKGASVKAYIGRVGGYIKMIFPKMIHHIYGIKVLVLYEINY